MGGVRAMVMGTRTGKRALFKRMATARAPPLEAASSAVRFLGRSSEVEVGSESKDGGGEGEERPTFWKTASTSTLLRMAT